MNDADKSTTVEPILTQQMTMHINGGSNFSQLQHAILADGNPTGIRRTTQTNGSPKYLKTVDVVWIGEEAFDVLATKGVGLKAWIIARLVPPLRVCGEPETGKDGEE